MEEKKVMRIPSLKMVNHVLSGQEHGWHRFYLFYDGLFRKMLTDSFLISGVVLKEDEIQVLMQNLWIEMLKAIRTFEVQDEDDFVIRDIGSLFQ